MHRFIILMAMLCCLLINGCTPKEEKPNTEEAKQFATALEKDAATRQINFLEKNIHIPVLMDRIYAMEEIKKLKVSKSGMEKGITQALKKHNYERTIFESLGNTGSFKIVKHYEKDGKARVIFRAFGAGGLNYLDMELIKLENKTGIADIYLYTTGENISKSMGSLSEGIMNANESTQKGLGPSFIAIREHIAKSEYQEAKDIYDGLPADIRSTKIMEALHISILPNLPGEKNLQELDILEKKYANDPNLQLMMIDVHLLKKDYEKALRSVDVIDRSINTDPFLDYYRGLIYNISEDKAKALAAYEKVVEKMPDFADAYVELIAQLTDIDERDKAKKYFDVYAKLKNKDPEVVSYYQSEFPYLAE